MESKKEKPYDHSHSFTVSISVYHVLLVLYPPEFRKAYGDSMKQLFRDCCRRALKEAGAAGLLSLWCWTLYDVIKSAIEENIQRGVSMTKHTFYQLSGWAMIVGPIIFMVGAWANNRPPYEAYNFASLPIDRYAGPAAIPLLVMGMLMMCFGIIGLMLRYVRKMNLAGILLGMGILAGLASSVGIVGVGINDSSPWWEIFILGMAVQYLALALFGFISLRYKLLPRWNGLPILGLWLPILMLLSMGLFSWEMNYPVVNWMWLLSVVMFAGLGHLLKSEVQSVPTLGTI